MTFKVIDFDTVESAYNISY